MSGYRAVRVEPVVLTDPTMAPLAAILHPRALAAHLGGWLHAGEAWLEVQDIELLRHHAGKRLVFEVTLQSSERRLTLIGKVYVKDRAHVYRFMEQLRRAGFDGEQQFSIPQPIAYLHGMHLLLQEKVDGRPATDHLLSNDASECAGAAERCATWLAAFHSMAFREGARFDANRQLDALRQWSLRVSHAGAHLADRATTLLAQLEAAASQVSAADLCTIHGDYSHHQVMLSAQRTITIDWDSYCLGDPALDVARFTVGLQRLALRRRGSMRALDDRASVFLAAYHAVAPAALATRVPFHRAAICLEHAKHDVHKQADDWRERAAASLAEGLRVLAEGC
jgi:aminoglycoside phosphotransferase (APT) family kinase protein